MAFKVEASSLHLPRPTCGYQNSITQGSWRGALARNGLPLTDTERGGRVL